MINPEHKGLGCELGPMQRLLMIQTVLPYEQAKVGCTCLLGILSVKPTVKLVRTQKLVVPTLWWKSWGGRR